MTNFWTDLTNNNIGRYNWITPDQYNEWHSALSGGYTYNGVHYTSDQAAIASGDNCLSIIIPKIMASAAYQDHGVIIIWTDETESTDDTNTTLPYVILSPMAKGNAYASTLPYNHSSDLKTMDEIFGLAYQTNAIPATYFDAQNDGKYDYVDGHSAPINDLSDFFQGVGTDVPALVVQQSGATLTNGAMAAAFGAVNIGANATEVLTVTNTGNGTLVLSNIVVTGANAGDFTVSGLTLPATVYAGQSTNFNVVFAPSVGGVENATLQITDNDTNNNPFTLALTGVGNAGLAITSQPAGATNNAGTTASFNVGATAYAALNYQWYFGTNVIAGQTNSTLGLASVGPTNVGSYYVVVNSAGASTNSVPANLTVIYQAPNVVGGQMMLTAGGGFQLAFSGPVGQTYEVLASDDLTLPQSQWAVVGTGTFGSTNVLFTDGGAANHPGRYYVVKSP